MPIEVLIAETMFHIAKSANEVRYIVLRPNVSENDDHQSGNMDMLSIYSATERLVMVGVACKSFDNWGSAAMKEISNVFHHSWLLEAARNI
jgi:hypothetical protein